MIYKTTIADQPNTIAKSIGAVREQLTMLDLSSFHDKAIGLCGIGASLEAARVLHGQMRKTGINAVVLEPSELVHLPAEKSLEVFIILSNSGNSVEPMRFLEQNPDKTFLVITNTADNPLANKATSRLSHLGGKDSTPSASGYTSTLIAGGLFIDALNGGASPIWDQLSDSVAACHQATLKRRDELADHLISARALDCVGGLSALATAHEAALLVREAARVPCWGFDTLNYLHGPMEAMDPSTGIIIFGSGREIQIAEDMAQRECPVLLITSKQVTESRYLKVVEISEIDNLVAREIVNIVPAQIVSAAMSDKLGLTDVKFRYRQTDTKLVPPSQV